MLVVQGGLISKDDYLDTVLACSIVAFRAVLTMHWEEAAAFAGMALRRLTEHADDQPRRSLLTLGLTTDHIRWTLHTLHGR